MSSKGQRQQLVHTRRFRFLFTLALPLAAATFGCGHATEEQCDTPSPVAIPQGIADDGVHWTRETEMQTSDERRLSEFFARNPSLAENPRISSSPLLYRGPGGKTRFYWVDNSRSPVEWSLVELGSGKGRYQEGQGGPF